MFTKDKQIKKLGLVVALSLPAIAYSASLIGTVSGPSPVSVIELQSGKVVKNAFGVFTFNNFSAGDAYELAYITPNGQTCEFTGTTPSSGAVDGNGTTGIVIDCKIATGNAEEEEYKISGIVEGANKDGVTISNTHGGQVEGVSSGFTLEGYKAGNPYDIRISSQHQNCTVTEGTPKGTINGDIGGINIKCTDKKYTITGEVAFTNSIVDDDITVSANRQRPKVNLSSPEFTITDITYPQEYTFSLVNVPSHYTCDSTEKKVSIGQDGTIPTVKFACSENPYKVGMTVRRLTNTLVVTHRGAKDDMAELDTPTVSFGPFIYGQVVTFGSDTADIIIPKDPKDLANAGTALDNQYYQECDFASKDAITINATEGLGDTIVGHDILCTDKEFYVSGKVQNLKGEVIIFNDDDTARSTIKLDKNTKDYNFPGYVYPNSYKLEIQQQPEHQTCTFSQPSGTFTIGQVGSIQYTDGNIQNNDLTCVDTLYSLSGTVKGYRTRDLQISLKPKSDFQNVKAETIPVSIDNPNFDFAQQLVADDKYEIVITQQPVLQQCRVIKNQSGTVNGSVDISVECQDKTNFAAGIAQGTYKDAAVPLTIASKDVGKQICEGSVDWGDGNVDKITNCVEKSTLTHKYEREGEFDVTVKVTKPSDMKGETTQSISVSKTGNCNVPVPNKPGFFQDSFEAKVP